MENPHICSVCKKDNKNSFGIICDGCDLLFCRLCRKDVIRIEPECDTQCFVNFGASGRVTKSSSNCKCYKYFRLISTLTSEENPDCECIESLNQINDIANQVLSRYLGDCKCHTKIKAAREIYKQKGGYIPQTDVLDSIDICKTCLQ